MVRGVVGEIGTLAPDTITVLDMEASIEHLSRGTLRDVDVLLIVAEPYFRALQTLGRTVPLARELGIPQMFVVANKVRTKLDEDTIRTYAAQLDLDVIGVIPWDPSVQEADQVNRSLIDHAATSPAARAIAEIVDRLATEREALTTVTH
jgi:CO dehydrogenase maturation factor